MLKLVAWLPLLFSEVALGQSTVFVWLAADISETQWSQWNWTAITHLGFFSDPSAALQAEAHSRGIRLVQARGLPAQTQWANATARAEWIEANVGYIRSQNYSGLSFDFEGNFLSPDEVAGYTALAAETKAAMQPFNGFLNICVGGRPSYEFRNYNYSGLAAVADHLFVMAYDLFEWDDYTCFLYNTCSPAQAPYRDVVLGITEYLQLVPPSKLVLGLPWYGNTYINIFGIVFKEGTSSLNQTLTIIASHPEFNVTWEDDPKSWRLACNGECLPGTSPATEIWYEDATTLAPKYQLARQYALQGVGMWNADDLDFVQFPTQSRAVWQAMTAALGP